jgi:hypothetical protein
MTLEERITQLEQRLAFMEGRVAALEAKNMTYGPLPTIPAPTTPVNPWLPKNPWEPPYTVTCKLADGTTKEFTLDSPILAMTNK